MFVNISNHPSSKWSIQQIEAAKSLSIDGLIIDIPFPDVNPEWGIKEIKEKAEEIFCQINFLETTNPSFHLLEGHVVHVMGEGGLTYWLVTKLLNVPYQVVHSTTRRIVEEVDGKKVSTFSFVQFRPYCEV